MIDEKYFFDKIRPSVLFRKGEMTQLAVNTILEIFKHYTDNPKFRYLRQLAYVLATAFHESAHTMNPGIREYGRGRGRKYGIAHPVTKQIYYGRGLPQLTWHFNYVNMGKRQSVEMEYNPDKALEMQYSVGNLMIGMIEGIFTGRKLNLYIDGDTTDWVNARRVVNGTDRAHLIAGYAKQFLDALRYTDVAYAADHENDKQNEAANVIILNEPLERAAAMETTDWITGTTRIHRVEMPDDTIAVAEPIITFDQTA